MKLLATLLFMSLLWQSANSQSVGINTNSPNASSVLDINSTNKGILLPKVSLQSITDKFTIPNPANALLLFNVNTPIGPEGFYYNMGDSDNPLWRMVGTRLNLPYSQTGTSGGALFFVENSSNEAGSIAISGLSEKIGVRGSSATGTGVAGVSDNGIGVHASSANGLALNVNGKVKIAGNGQSPGQGKLLTSDANGNASWQAPAINLIAFSELGIDGGGNINSTQGLTPVKVNFGNIAYNLGNAYDGVTNSFTAPFNGIYHFDAMIEWKHANPELIFDPGFRLIRSRNNVETEIAFDFAFNAAFRHTSVITIDCELQQGDKVYATGKSGKNGVELETSNSTAHFNGRLLQKL
ncbi:complement C1q domain-containing protein [Dyadobacter chenhuakuii]|uniref:Complement C1q domain-containing protein n=1 Tax=Dyadobacter chenhuakuii TaxID=2909339 RepID=A0ABY4XSD6_9BACT|nr:complement C1q domain-containing protein [Dyadobacter chenhuakuii]MCF2492403.1 complement C1q domain-containing protein [Dyadobacter chenhuakuii]USJ33295.1 complement C1q domain-containing protein [Dyadobacter chenhuakuii]